MFPSIYRRMEGRTRLKGGELGVGVKGGRKEKMGQRKERGEKLRKIGRGREKEENFACEKPTPRAGGGKGLGGGLPCVNHFRMVINYTFILQ